MSLITCTFEKVRMDLITGKAIRKVTCLPKSRGEVLVQLEGVTPLTKNAKELVRLYRKDEDNPEEYLNELLGLAVRSNQHFIATHIAFALSKRSNESACLSLPYSEGDGIIMETKEGKSLGTIIMPTSENHYAVRLNIDNQIRQRVKTSALRPADGTLKKIQLQLPLRTIAPNLDKFTMFFEGFALMGPRCHKRLFPPGIFNDAEVECDVSLLPGLFGATSACFKSCIYALDVLMKERYKQRVVLRLCGNWLGYRGIMSLESSVRSLTNLRELYLSKNGLGPDGAKVLTSILCDLDHLEVLDLRRNALGPEGVRRVFSCLASNSNPLLRVLDVSSNFMQDQGVEYVSDAFSSGGFSELKVLRMSGNQIGHEGAKQMFKALTISLSRSDDNELFEDVKQEVQQHEMQLKTFDFSYNKIGPKAAPYLSEFLKSSIYSLCNLHLRSCSLLSEGLIEITDSLCDMKKLKVLDISKNKMSPDAGDCLMRVSNAVATLQEFSIANNRIRASVSLAFKRRYNRV